MAVRNREASDLVRQAEARGWRVRAGGHGTVLQCPAVCRCQVSVAHTPGGYRYVRNVTAILRRCHSWGPE